MCMCTKEYLPVQRSLITVEGVHYDEKFTVLLLQVDAFAIMLTIFYHLHDGLVGRRMYMVSQKPESAEGKLDDILQILNKNMESDIERLKQNLTPITITWL